MDTSKWKSILIKRPIYEEIKEHSLQEGRKISTQLQMIWSWYKEAQGIESDCSED